MNGRVACAAFAVVFGLAGCAGKDPWEANRPKVVPVSGSVSYNGKPVDGASVTFSNPTANLSAYGTTGADGRFTLTTFNPGDGAAPGAYQVSVRKVEMVSRAKENFDYAASSEVPPPPVEKWVIPARYGKFDSSHLSAEVTEAGPNTFTFELKD